jgi:membrane-bound ClpP family serine protease
MGELGRLLASNVPEMILLLIGVGLMVLEIYIPGFGLPGIMGIGLTILGFALLRPAPPQGLLLLLILAAIVCVALVIFMITASRGRLEKSRLALKDVALSPDAPNALAGYVGREGTAHTALRPAGIGSFDGERLNVVSDGEFIPEGTAIRVQSVEGNKVVVVKI